MKKSGVWDNYAGERNWKGSAGEPKTKARAACLGLQGNAD